LTNSQAGYTDYARTALVTDWLEELGWYSKVCLEDGLTRTIQSILDGTNEN